MDTLYTLLDFRWTMASGDLGAVKLGIEVRVSHGKAIKEEKDGQRRAAGISDKIQTPR